MTEAVKAEPKSHFTGALAVLPKLKAVVDGKDIIVTAPFLEACREVLPVVDVFGAALAIVKSDVGGNIERLSKALAKEPEEYQDLYQMVRDEKAADTALGRQSNTNAILWLTRAMDFLLGLLRKLEEDKETTVKGAVDAAYAVTLSPYHNWLARSAFSAAMFFCPTRDQFFTKLGEEYVPGDLMLVLAKFEPVLQEIHQFLDSEGYNELVAI